MEHIGEFLFSLIVRSVYRQEIHLAQHILEKLENVFPCIEYSTCFDNTLLIHQAKCAMAQLEGDYERALRICNEWEKLSISKGKRTTNYIINVTFVFRKAP